MFHRPWIKFGDYQDLIKPTGHLSEASSLIIWPVQVYSSTFRWFSFRCLMRFRNLVSLSWGYLPFLGWDQWIWKNSLMSVPYKLSYEIMWGNSFSGCADSTRCIWNRAHQVYWFPGEAAETVATDVWGEYHCDDWSSCKRPQEGT